MIINPKTKQAYQLLHKGTLALARAEQQGIRVDVDYVKSKKEYLTRKINHLENKFKLTKFYKHWVHTIGGKVPNINSNTQLARLLYKVKKLKPTKTTVSGQGSTDEEALLQLEIPEMPLLLEIRKLKKIRDTYLEAFMREQIKGYIHPFFNLHLVKTYRSSSDKPNFQNIPKRDKEAMQTVRKALYPRPGHQLLSVDYSGLEVRIAACYHKDKTMLKYINNPASDMHRDMAEQIYLISKIDKSISSHVILRNAAKNGFVFPEFYGDYYKNCAESLACSWGELSQNKWKSGEGISLPNGTLSDHLLSKNINSLKQFTEHIKNIEQDFWENRFPEYKAWKKRWWKSYQKCGYIDLLTGFRCSGVLGQNDAINYPVQGAAFHCLLWSFIEIDAIIVKEKWKTKLLGQIHDEIILDVPPNELVNITRIIKRITCVDLPKAWPWIIVPLDVDMEICPVDGNWADKKEYVL